MMGQNFLQATDPAIHLQVEADEDATLPQNRGSCKSHLTIAAAGLMLLGVAAAGVLLHASHGASLSGSPTPSHQAPALAFHGGAPPSFFSKSTGLQPNKQEAVSVAQRGFLAGKEAASVARRGFLAGLLGASLAVAPMTGLPSPAFADGSRLVGEVAGSGFVFKDTLKIEEFDDPKVAGVQLYLSNFQRPLTEKLSKGDLFSDPGQGGLTCSHAGRVVVSPSASTDAGGEEVFSEARSLLFKSLKVRRIVDKEGQSVVYAVYSQRLDKGDDINNSRFKSALCAVHVDEFAEK